MGGIMKRQIEVGSDTCIKGFGGRDYIQSAVFDATTLQKVGQGGVNEVQTATITGTPTGGTFKLGVNAVLTAGIAYNATADAVRDALEAIAPVGVDNVSVTGSAGGPYTITFHNALGNANVAQMTKDASLLTGGTSPNVTVATTTTGVERDNDGRYLLGTGDFPGTIVTISPADNTKIKEFVGASGEAVIGICDGEVEFISNTPEGHRDVALYNSPGLVLDHTKIKNYGTYSSQLATWALTRGVVIE